MTQEPGPVRAPEFPKNVTWLQGGPLTLAQLRGRQLLIDTHDLTIVTDSDGLSLYAFTFLGCLVPGA